MQLRKKMDYKESITNQELTLLEELNEKAQEVNILQNLAKDMIKNEFDDWETDEVTKGSISNTTEENGTSHSLSQLKKHWIDNALSCLIFNCSENISINICPQSHLMEIIEEEKSVIQYEKSSAAEAMCSSSDNVADRLKEKHISTIPGMPQNITRSNSSPVRIQAESRNSMTIHPSPISDLTNQPDQGVRVKVDQIQELQLSPDESDLQQALFLSTTERQCLSRNNSISALSKVNNNGDEDANFQPVETDSVEIQTLAELYRQDFQQQCCSSGSYNQIQVSYISTYQGRVSGSSNGCTVIAPLLLVHYLNSRTLQNGIFCSKNSNTVAVLMTECLDYSDGKKIDRSKEDVPQDCALLDVGIKDATIRAVIDAQTPLVLPIIRDKLGLKGNALIIPSDVNDYFIENEFLKPNQFHGVFGGNIMDSDHLRNFLISFLNTKKDNKQEKRLGKSQSTINNSLRKIGATLYFHEHVIVIYRLTQRIDSAKNMPQYKRKRFFSRKNRVNSSGISMNQGKDLDIELENTSDAQSTVEEKNIFDVIDSLPSTNMLSVIHSSMVSDDNSKPCVYREGIQQTVKIRCTSIKSLETTLKHLACSKFTEEDQIYINNYRWNDSNVDFDPRVFQAFVWSEP